MCAMGGVPQRNGRSAARPAVEFVGAVAWLALMLAGHAAAGPRVLADTAAPAATLPAGSIRANDVTVLFAASLDFRLEAVLPAAAVAGVLRYSTGPDEPIQRRRAEVSRAGTATTARYHEAVSRGQIPPASTLRWWWTLTLTDGSELVTSAESATYLDQRFDWRQLDRGGVRVWTYGDDDGLAESVAASTTAAMARASDRLGLAIDRRVQVVTYRRRDDMLAALVDRGGTYEERLATLGARVAPDIVLLLAEPGFRDVDAVLAHELSHLVLHLGLAEPYLDVPLWLDEGLAMVAEGDLPSADRRLLERAIRADELMSLRSLSSFPGRAELVPLAYAESHDVVTYLWTDRGPDVFRAFIADLGTGESTVDEALLRHYGADQVELYQRYRAARGMAPAEPAAATAARRGAARPPLCLTALVLPALALATAWDRRRQSPARIRR
jgi:hypothetical protein